jgi:hypothetical protein
MIKNLVELVRKKRDSTVWIQTAESEIEEAQKPKLWKKNKSYMLIAISVLFFLLLLYVVFAKFGLISHQPQRNVRPIPSIIPSPIPTPTEKVDVGSYLTKSLDLLKKQLDNLWLNNPTIELPQIHTDVRL